MSDNETNSNSVVTKQGNDLDLNKTMQGSLNLEAVKGPKKLKERITDLLKGDTEFSKMKQGDKILVVSAASGLFTAVLPLLAVGATLAIPGAIVGLALYFAVKVAVKAVQSGYKGLEWSAKKTVKGAEKIGGNIKDGAVRARDSVKETVSSVGQATREGTGAALKKVGDKLGNLGASMSSLDRIPYSIESQGQTVVLKTEEKTKNFNSVKEMLVNEILKDKTVNKSALTKEIFSKLGEKILGKAYSVDGQQSAKKDQLINRLKQQVDFINKLSAKKLQNLLAQDDNNLYEIFSEHHDEIKRIIGECKTEHKLSNSIENLNKVAGKYGKRIGSMQSQFGGNGVEKLPQKPFSSDLGVIDSNGMEKRNLAPTKPSRRSPSPDSRISSSGSSMSRRQSLSLEDEWSEFIDERMKNHALSARTNGGDKEQQKPPTFTPKLPRSSSMDPVSSSSEKRFATVDPKRLRRSSSSSLIDGSPALKEVASPELPRNASLPDLNASSQNSLSESFASEMKETMDKVFEQKNKGTLTRSSSAGSLTSSDDSGFNSPSSSLTHTMFTNKDGALKTRVDLKKTGHLDKLVGQPSSKVDKVKSESTQVKTV
jgi:hypothetical protein